MATIKLTGRFECYHRFINTLAPTNPREVQHMDLDFLTKTLPLNTRLYKSGCISGFTMGLWAGPQQAIIPPFGLRYFGAVKWVVINGQQERFCCGGDSGSLVYALMGDNNIMLPVGVHIASNDELHLPYFIPLATFVAEFEKRTAYVTFCDEDCLDPPKYHSDYTDTSSTEAAYSREDGQDVEDNAMRGVSDDSAGGPSDDSAGDPSDGSARDPSDDSAGGAPDDSSHRENPADEEDEGDPGPSGQTVVAPSQVPEAGGAEKKKNIIKRAVNHFKTHPEGLTVKTVAQAVRGKVRGKITDIFS
ncbi:hypothetical protein ABW21_db0207323 [Orbilia brochopaga]|nr:hypothetical protein ABW21_db0207323 [Drechslerella brochopaga]